MAFLIATLTLNLAKVLDTRTRTLTILKGVSMINYIMMIIVCFIAISNTAHSGECVNGNCKLRNRTVVKQPVVTNVPTVTKRNSSYTRSNYRYYRTRTVR